MEWRFLRLREDQSLLEDGFRKGAATFAFCDGKYVIFPFFRPTIRVTNRSLDFLETSFGRSSSPPPVLPFSVRAHPVTVSSALHRPLQLASFSESSSHRLLLSPLAVADQQLCMLWQFRFVLDNNRGVLTPQYHGI
ncbi:hypothetical protein QN277_003213 [Acacia crassicarpa]|uniref:Uncharacterized protein n=1 Tax=Acacia crassicarpa TaxID=499986 RepID=A0AAE1IY18_9FABA|nr:hypothetical protein QN277_003213 [Acacia crassicarpa]